MKTKDVLGIVWEGEETKGCIAYGFWPTPNIKEPTFPENVWPSGFDYVATALGGTGWSVWMWEIMLPQWPAEEVWRSAVSGTMKAMLRSGAGLAWFGLDGCFADPPGLFSPEFMSRGVWAFHKARGGQYGPPALGLEYLPIVDSELTVLRDYLGLK